MDPTPDVPCLEDLSTALAKARSDRQSKEHAEKAAKKAFYTELPGWIVRQNLEHIKSCAKRGFTGCDLVNYQGGSYQSIEWEKATRLAVAQLTSIGAKTGFRVTLDKDLGNWHRVSFGWGAEDL